MIQTARKKEVARAREAITTLYQQQRETYMAKMEAIRHAESQDGALPIIASISGQGNEYFAPEISKSLTSPKRFTLKSPKSLLKSPLRSPASKKKKR
jgi:hypothetical protein